jgi:RNA-directed DNA polymerase
MKGNFHVRFLGEGKRGNTLPLPDNQTSQFWANVFLHELDQFVKQTLRCPASSPRSAAEGGYLRYCDDFALFADNKPILHQWRQEIEVFLASLRLRLHPLKSTVYPVINGVPFLGFLVFPDHRRLRRDNGVYFERRLKRMLAGYAAGAVSREELDASVRGWVAHAAHGDTWRLRWSILRRFVIPSQEARR